MYKLIAHRGLVNNSIDNSLESLLNGINSDKYIGIETDVRVTKDNIFILYHDPLYKGKLVKQTCYKEFKKNNIITLEQLLKIKTNKILLLEIKDYSINLHKLLKLLNRYNRNIYLMSFSNKVINDLKQLNTKYKLGVLNYILNTESEYKYDFICIINTFITPKLINNYKSKNIEIFSYGIRSIKSIKYKNINYIVDNKYVE